MTIHVIEKPVKGGTVQAVIDNLHLRVTNAALHQVAEKMSNYLNGFACPAHPAAVLTGSVEVEGESIDTPGAYFLTKLANPCCKEIEMSFEEKVKAFFDQYKSME